MDHHIDKLDFLEAYPKARTEAFKSENIKNGFAATGLVPFQPDRVLLQLNIQLKTPTPPGSRAGTIPTNWVPETPHNIVELQHQAATIKALLKRRTQSPPSPTNAALNQLIKGCQLAMNSAVILAKENHDLRAANEKQKQKRKRSTNQISHEGGLSIQEAQALIQSQISDENQVPLVMATTAAEAASAPLIKLQILHSI
ncbi:Transposase [Rasamsonia emersonii CBS 393.64]|uniref:Transposase n=1 Tax=Rasamsonia emersonii (strain ATCC 16479 / CBS 393.64 / IMI 116815) TaxID=1408163 RepID=A0A0F4YGB7_RASE3|nr:Transposase [Rasamsonia emersonii CBS 393.64]KKA17135.1 Transposase [Rasamsonia emersonii CBS 393.64]